MTSNLTTLKAELLKEFDEKWFRSQNGNELYPPIPFGEKEIKNFLSHALDRAIREVLVGVLPLEVEDCGDHNGIGECCRNAARAEMISRAKLMGVEIV